MTYLSDVKFSPDGSRIAVYGGLPGDMGGGSHVALFDALTGAEVKRLHQQEKDIKSIFFLLHSPTLVAVTEQGPGFWDSASGEQLYPRSDLSALTKCCDVDGEGRWFVGWTKELESRVVHSLPSAGDDLDLAAAYALLPMSCVAPPRIDYNFNWNAVKNLPRSSSTHRPPPV